MEKKKIFTAWQIAPWLVFLAIFSFAVWAGLSDPQFQYLHAPGWSRAKLVGVTDQRAPVPVVVDDDGNSYFLIVSERTLKVRALGPAGQSLWEASYEAWSIEPSDYRLIRENGTLHLLWREESLLFTAALTMDGEPSQATNPLELPVAVAFYAAIANQDGLHIWVSDAANRPGLYAIQAGGPPQLIDADGAMPLLQLDSLGNLHAIWQQQRSAGILNAQYAVLPVNGQLSPQSEIATINASRARLRGPWFEVEDDQGYLSYAIDFLVDPGARQSFAKYIPFTLATQTTASDLFDFRIPYGRFREYAELADGPAESRAEFPERFGRPANPLEVATIASATNAPNESVAALRVSVEHLKQREISQIAIQFWQDGQPSGYQLLTFSGRASQQPALTRIADGNYAVTFLEGTPGAYAVYYATTAPDTTEAFNSRKVDDAR